MDNLESLQRESNTTLTFLYVVISASFSGAVKLFSGGHSVGLALALSILCVYLAVLAAYLIFSCLMARTVKSPANEPKNLKIPPPEEGKNPYTSEQIQDFELENLQSRIEFNRNRNDKTARHLNIVRVMICASPIIFLLAIAFFGALSALCGENWF